MTRPLVYVCAAAALVLMLFWPIVRSPGAIASNYGDVYQHYYPLKYLASERLIAGEIPLWNPYIFTGQPLLANPQSAVFYPLSALFCVLPLHTAFNYFEMLHVFMGAYFFFLLLKYYGRTNAASAAASFAFSFSAFVLYKIAAGHPAALSGYVWLPMIMLLTEKTALETRFRTGALLSLALVFQFLSGHTFPVYISAAYLLIFILLKKAPNFRSFAAALAFAAAIAAVQLIPSYELSQAAETGNLAALAGAYSLPMRNLINFLLPNYFGNIIEGSFVQQSNPSYFFELHPLYIGFLPLLAAIWGIAVSLKKRLFFYPVMFAAGLFLAAGLNNPAYGFFYDILPGLDFLRVPARFILLSISALLVMSAFAMDRVLPNLSNGVKAAVILLIVAELFSWNGKFIRADRISAYRSASGVTAGVQPLYRIITQPGTIMPNKSMLYHNFNLNGYEAIFLSDFTRYLGLREKKTLDAVGLSRTDLDSPLSRAYSVGYLVTADTRDDLKLERDTGSGVRLYALPRPLPRIFIAGGFRIFQKEDIRGQLDYLKHTHLPPEKELMLLSGHLPDRILNTLASYEGRGSVVSYEFSANKVTAELRLERPSALVLSDVFYNGWKAASGSASHAVYRGHKVFRTVFLAAGDYTGVNKLILYYDPGSFKAGLILTSLALLTMAVFFIKDLFKPGAK